MLNSKSITIKYSHEFITNRIIDELIMHSIINFIEIEKNIIDDVYLLLNYNIGENRNMSQRLL